MQHSLLSLGIGRVQKQDQRDNILHREDDRGYAGEADPCQYLHRPKSRSRFEKYDGGNRQFEQTQQCPQQTDGNERISIWTSLQIEEI